MSNDSCEPTRQQIKSRAEEMVAQFIAHHPGQPPDDIATELQVNPLSKLELAAYATAYGELAYQWDRGGCVVHDDCVVEPSSVHYEGYNGVVFMAHILTASAAVEFIRENLGEDAAEQLENHLGEPWRW